MGGETANTAKIAENVSTEIFQHFRWNRVGISNKSWSCVIPSHKKINHPSDAVYCYEEAYDNQQTYVLCDFKSYAKGSITPSSLVTSLLSLNIALSCAKFSDEFKQLFIDESRSHNIVGLLFIYNNDNEFDRNFESMLDDVSHKIKVSESNRIFVMGPRDITYLDRIAQNMLLLRGAGKLPPKNNCSFFSLEIPQKKVILDPSQIPLSLEYATSDVQLLRYSNDPKSRAFDGLDVYLRFAGNSVEDFLYIFDMLRCSYIFHEKKTIRFFLPNACELAPINFQKAIKRYGYELNVDYFKDIENCISYESITRLNAFRFNEIIVGMKNE
jgi:hypothetical protein